MDDTRGVQKINRCADVTHIQTFPMSIDLAFFFHFIAAAFAAFISFGAASDVLATIVATNAVNATATAVRACRCTIRGFLVGFSEPIDRWVLIMF